MKLSIQNEKKKKCNILTPFYEKKRRRERKRDYKHNYFADGPIVKVAFDREWPPISLHRILLAFMSVDECSILRAYKLRICAQLAHTVTKRGEWNCSFSHNRNRMCNRIFLGDDTY
ncbi:hypothetical protein NPIL_108591 [Nephila pilipes]|uniref:Uncharacterized protein n=1 Tax=Nephila pilipes TaxID=299642 RepID=A0A8X6PJ93_NEPPI|nr:hypothetical protein NPIL_390751 [Nephila pilipes]GFT73712.1 hypothetical protein NPIL_108591 [Nephila pilipes]